MVSAEGGNGVEGGEIIPLCFPLQVVERWGQMQHNNNYFNYAYSYKTDIFDQHGRLTGSTHEAPILPGK